jgi:thioesterase DpgC
MVTATAAYETLTNGHSRFLRVDELCRLGSEKFSSLLPSQDALAREAQLRQKDKQGLEKRQGEFLAEILGDPQCGTHLCHAMLLPRKDSRDLLAQYQRQGVLDLGAAQVRREGKAAIVTMRNSRHLNAEDEVTLGPLETAIDVALLDPDSQICVLRGDVVSNLKYAGRLFGAGINLTHLYAKIRPLVHPSRLGLVNKPTWFGFTGKHPEESSIENPGRRGRGLRDRRPLPDPAAVDYTLAASDAYMTLPARKEGIVPGAATLRLPRFVGDRSRAKRLNERRIDCDSPAGRMICDEIVPPEDMDVAITNIVDRRRARRRERRGQPPRIASPRSRSTPSGATCRSTPASRRTATSAPR